MVRPLSKLLIVSGFALNVNNDLSSYRHIIPCGISDKGVTSMSKELNRKIEINEVVPVLLNNMQRVFDVDMEMAPLDADEIKKQ